MGQSGEHERRAHFRGRTRPGRRLPVRVRTSDGTSFDAHTRDIGVGGAFVETTTALAIGTAVTLVVRLPTSPREFQLGAVVRWVDPSAGGGAGVQFVDVEIDVLLELNEHFGALTNDGT